LIEIVFLTAYAATEKHDVQQSQSVFDFTIKKGAVNHSAFKSITVRNQTGG
jgi:hypothetical protein